MELWDNLLSLTIGFILADIAITLEISGFSSRRDKRCITVRVRPILCRRPIPDTIGCSYTNTDTGLCKFFVLKMRFCAGYWCVQVIYVCGVYARKYGIGLKL